MSLQDSQYSLNYFREGNYSSGNYSRRGKLLTLGLPLGSAIVLIAVLNTIFSLESILNFSELVTITGSFTAKHHLLYLVVVTFLFILTLYLWFAVIFTGRGYHLSIWIAGTLLLLLLKIVISSWALLVSLSYQNPLYWRKLWSLGIDIGMEVYIVSVAVVVANVMWQRDDDPYTCNYDYERYDDTISIKPLPPVGLHPVQIWRFFYQQNVELGARVLIMADVIYCIYTLITEKIPEVLIGGYGAPAIPDDVEATGFISPDSHFGHTRFLLIFFEDTVIRLCRCIAGIVTVSFLMKRQSSKEVTYSLIANLALISISMLLYFLLFALFEDLTVTDRFYQVAFTGDLLFRLGIIIFLIKSVEKRRLQQNANSHLPSSVQNQYSQNSDGCFN